MKICFIVPYMGVWPWWLPHYLRSCSFNPEISWLLIGDVEPQVELTANISFVRMDFAGINALAAKQLGRAVDIQKPYKLCDLRVAFGKVFEDYLAGYDFWGHTDLDILYGDIKGLIPERALEEFDIITPYSVSCGHFQLYRNTPEINSLYQQLDNLDAMLVGDKYELYDHMKLSSILEGSRWFKVQDYQKELQKNECFLGATIMVGGNIVYEEKSGDEVYIWEDGHAYQLREGRKREFLYLHFMGLKNDDKFKVAGSRLQVGKTIDARPKTIDPEHNDRGKVGSEIALAVQGSYRGQRAGVRGDGRSPLPSRARTKADVGVLPCSAIIERALPPSSDYGKTSRQDKSLRDGGECLVLSGDGIREISAGELRRLEIRNRLRGGTDPLRKGVKKTRIILGVPFRIAALIKQLLRKEGVLSFINKVFPRMKTAAKATYKRRALGLIVSARVFLFEHGKIRYHLVLRIPGNKEDFILKGIDDVQMLDQKLLDAKSS